MTVGHTYRLNMRGHLRSQRVMFGLHIRHDGPSGSVADLAASAVGNLLPLVLAATSLEVNWDDVQVSDTSPTGDETLVFPFTQPQPGLITGDCLPGQDTALISFRTGVKGRRRHGRAYIPGVSESSQSNGRITGAQLTAMTALADGIIDLWGPSGSDTNYRQVVYSPPTPPFVAKPPPPVHTDTIVTPVTVALTDPIIRTQRRRMIGVGE